VRDKLNENPVAQIALIGVLALLGGYLVLTNLGGGSSSSAATESASIETAAPAAATSAVTAPIGGKLPHKVVAAYGHGKTVVLYVYRHEGLDDAATALGLRDLRKMPNVALFLVSTKQVARYSAITGPIGVDRAPALVVVRGKKHNGDEPAPATVSYGFMRAPEMRQAVIDAGYTGPETSYAPN
jgi:hypothetical protein